MNGRSRALQQAEEQLCAVCLERRKEVPYGMHMPTPVCIIVVAMQWLMELQEQAAAFPTSYELLCRWSSHPVGTCALVSVVLWRWEGVRYVVLPLGQ